MKDNAAAMIKMENEYHEKIKIMCETHVKHDEERKVSQKHERAQYSTAHLHTVCKILSMFIIISTFDSCRMTSQMEFEEHFRHFEASTRNEMRALQDTMTSQGKVMLDMQDTHRIQCAQAKDERMVW